MWEFARHGRNGCRNDVSPDMDVRVYVTGLYIGVDEGMMGD